MSEFPTTYQEFLFKRTYAKFLFKEKRRENWDETIDRYKKFFDEKVPDNYKTEFNKVIEDIRNCKVVPSMRALWTAGEALRRENICGYNCFSPETEFFTSKGIKKFSDCKDNQEVFVLSNDGAYNPAIIKSFGEEKVFTITFKKASSTYIVKATGNHRWITIDKKHKYRNILTTTELTPGTIIPSMSSKKLPYLCDVGIEHGIVYGDGSQHSNKTDVSDAPCCITLCDDSIYLKKYFRKTGNLVKEGRYTIVGLPHLWKNLPSLDSNVQYLAGFMAGWFASDGSFSRGREPVLACNNKEALNWARVACSKIGIRTYAIRTDFRQNPFAKTNKEDIKPIYYLPFEMFTVSREFFLHNKHYDMYNTDVKRNRFEWKVVSIEDFNETVNVWCVQEPKTETFTLANGMITKNCAAANIDNPKVFSEILYLALCGTGIGISVERQHINKLPIIPETLGKKTNCKTIVFEDSRLGWAQGFQEVIDCLYSGKMPECDYSKVRPKGALIKTFGGRASGPEPLKGMIEIVKNMFLNAKGRKLNSLECHDLAMHIASVIVVGGVRRTAMISLSNRSDDRMAHAKDGEFWLSNPQRSYANNSIAYTEKPTPEAFIEDWLTLIRSKSGERGIFNREAAEFVVQNIGRRKTGFEWTCNPCSEIVLRPQEFCNLSEVIIRHTDTKKELCDKVRAATILGCLQSTLTKFNFLRKEWKKNCEEERLLGVSLTGLMDHPILNKVSKDAKVWLAEMKQTAIEAAKEWSSILGINTPVAITCVKPSGSVSQLMNTASGLHTRHSQFYIRRVRVTRTDPLAQFMIDSGVPHNPEVGEQIETCNNVVFDFPQAAPSTSVTRDDMTATDQLNYWLMLQKHWCEHKPSATISVKDEEWIEVGAWVYKNWNWVSGISFLPYDGGVYQLAPYEEIEEEEYNKLIENFPDIDFAKFVGYESEDMTEGAKELACSASGGCEL